MVQLDISSRRIQSGKKFQLKNVLYTMVPFMMHTTIEYIHCTQKGSAPKCSNKIKSDSDGNDICDIV